MELPGELDPEQKLLPRDDACMRDKKGERERGRTVLVLVFVFSRTNVREKKGRGKERKDDVTSTVTQRIT